ncbi:hypothetical protein BCR36DRAFT_349758 [Piromyces finnis]|uniref:Uncharacterized protein n=1 Tax=Piromyces finnis TaxID=1754191 RepID=A0A1Y1VDQ1_9FUNG|nr:hypothetical protein BCR36DRAFT_349758 [Piromyces finnis]|eukprot:ORX53011.1 hypothetical protein BCR36DRAFT_349758 [Piromyces finnis]
MEGSEKVDKDDPIFPNVVDKSNLIIYQVSQSISTLIHSFNDKIRILQKWYHLIRHNVDPSKEYENLFENIQFYEKEKVDRNTDNDPTEIKLYPNTHQNPLIHERTFQSANSATNKIKLGEENNDDDNDELNINRFHYSMPNQIISKSNKIDMENEQNANGRLFKRNNGCGDPQNYFCESQCNYYKGAPMIIRESYAPMYNCSGRFLTNVDDKEKLPLLECDTCSPKNTTCLNWCCQLMDTTVNIDIPEFLNVEKKINGTMTNTTVENPDLNKVCYCPLDRYGPNCQNFYETRCNLTLLSHPTDECFDSDGERVKGLKYLDKTYNCPLYNYTDIITLRYNLTCEQVPSAGFSLSLATNNYTFFAANKYIMNKLPLYKSSKDASPLQLNTRIWNFNHLGSSIDLVQELNDEHLVGNKTIEVVIDLGKYYLPTEKLKSVFNGGRVIVETGFGINVKLMGSGVPKPILSFLNLENYFKNEDFFEKEVIFKTIKQILSVVIPIVSGCVILFVIFVVITYILYRKTRPMKVSC